MQTFHFRYGLNDTPPWWVTGLYGLQWLAVSIPGILIIGRVVGTFHSTGAAEQILYLQKIFLITGVSLALQILCGHRLPLIMGPAAVLLIGLLATRGFSLESVYGAILVNGLLMAFFSLSGLFERVRRYFTTMVVVAVLLLIAFSLMPTVLDLIVAGKAAPAPVSRLAFALPFILAMFLFERRLKGVWKALLLAVAMVSGSLAYGVCFGVAEAMNPGYAPPWLASPLAHPTVGFSFDWGLCLSFFFCFMALAINDIGSIQSLKEFFPLTDMEGRTRVGMALTGLSNAFSGLTGVIGSVNYSISPGLIVSTGCASRFTLLPCAAALIVLSLSPAALACMAAIPHPVIGCILFHILSNQVAAGLMVATAGEKGFSTRRGLSVAIPVLLGTLFSFLPPQVVVEFPRFLRPMAGNGFVVGVLASLLVEHLVFREKMGNANA